MSTIFCSWTTYSSPLITSACRQGKAVLVPNIFYVFFSIPSPASNETDAGFSNSNTWPTSRYKLIDNNHFRLLPLYHAALMKSMSDPSDGDSTVWEIKSFLAGHEDLIKNTVLDTKSLWSSYCVILQEVSNYYSSGFRLRRRMPVNLNEDFEQQVFFFSVSSSTDKCFLCTARYDRRSPPA